MDHVKRGVRRADDVRDNRWRLPLSNSMDRLLTFVLFSSSNAKSLGAKIDEDMTKKVHENVAGDVPVAGVNGRHVGVLCASPPEGVEALAGSASAIPLMLAQIPLQILRRVRQTRAAVGPPREGVLVQAEQRQQPAVI